MPVYPGALIIGGTTPSLSFSGSGTTISAQNSSQELRLDSHETGHIITFYTGPSTGIERMRIDNGGNVGIGTTSPGAKLEVDGNVKLTSGSGASITFADGTTQTTAWTGTVCGGDYAESVGVRGGRKSYKPGDVMVIDPGSQDGFAMSSKPYSRLVAGIYSTKPGLTGRRFNDKGNVKNEVPMAVVGIVPTMVSAENGPVEPGDLLVTSSTPGYAMKGTDQAKLTGAILGKALGSVKSGKGVIDVLVSLQ